MTSPSRAVAPLISAQDITVSRDHKTLLDSVSLSLFPREIVTLIGPNGAGKTTLLRVFLGIIPADRGQVIRQPNLRIGYVPQRLHVEPVLPLTAGRFITLDLRAKAAAYTEVLAMTGAESLVNKMLYELSGGELQRVALARALMRSPQLLLLDEPVQGVDKQGQFELYDLISRVKTQLGVGVLLVSHDLHLVMSQSDRVICLERHICCSGHPDSVLTDPAYLRLFGPRVASQLAVFTHTHPDHKLDL